MKEPTILNKLIFELSKLPGIGEKSATRFAYYILKQPRAYAASLAECLSQLHTKVTYCETCNTFCETAHCNICADPFREKNIICVLEKPSDILCIERMRKFQGTYHILHGLLSPIHGIGPEQLKIQSLLARIQPETQEVILALNPSLEGQTTSLYLVKQLKKFAIKVTQLAYGISMSSSIEYTDLKTLDAAFEHRTCL